ncbi:hypothetical protein Csp1_19780 [Corynebacterium provencense]|uniref:Transposase IS4-like domain-containing protein n=2 Tax=Corynebacterium provencense TaxID=1737425 RepID=A0A2Z3YQ03_9CORY|nr:hypothetical protein Csp1_19780 [Corynebacterium provencense]
MITGKSSYTAITQWINDEANTTLTDLGIKLHRRPSEPTIRRVLYRLDADLLDRVIGTWMLTRTGVTEGRRHIAVDGKTLRGARDHSDPDSRAPHEVSAFDADAGMVVGQVEVDAKTNEIPAARDLPGLFDLTGTVVSLDEDDTAEFIIDAGGDYVMTVKKNRKALYARAKALGWDTNRVHTTVERGHGRQVIREAQVFVVGEEFGFPHAAQGMKITRRRVDYNGARIKGNNKKGNKSTEVVYVVCSLGHVEAPVAMLARWVQRHWGIENKLHRVRDVVFGEDASLIRTGVGPRVMATLRNTAISVLRLIGREDIEPAQRYFAAVFDRPTLLVMTIHHRL